MATVKRFEELECWQEARKFVNLVYEISRNEGFRKDFELTGQVKRSAISTMANIAEGFKRRGKADKVSFFNIAQGSLEETRYYLILARDLGYADTERLLDCVDEIGRMLYSYIRSIHA